MINRVSSYFQKGGHSATQTELNSLEKREVKPHRNIDTKTDNREPQQNYSIIHIVHKIVKIPNLYSRQPVMLSLEI